MNILKETALSMIEKGMFEYGAVITREEMMEHFNIEPLRDGDPRRHDDRRGPQKNAAG